MIGTVRENKLEIPKKRKDKTTQTTGFSALLFTKDVTLVLYVPETPFSKKTVLFLSSMQR